MAEATSEKAFIPSAGRLDRILTLAGELEGGRIRLAAFQMQHPLLGFTALKQRIYTNYLRTLLPEFVKLVGSSHFLGRLLTGCMQMIASIQVANLYRRLCRFWYPTFRNRALATNVEVGCLSSACLPLLILEALFGTRMPEGEANHLLSCAHCQLWNLFWTQKSGNEYEEVHRNVIRDVSCRRSGAHGAPSWVWPLQLSDAACCWAGGQRTGPGPERHRTWPRGRRQGAGQQCHHRRDQCHSQSEQPGRRSLAFLGLEQHVHGTVALSPRLQWHGGLQPALRTADPGLLNAVLAGLIGVLAEPVR